MDRRLPVPLFRVVIVVSVRVPGKFKYVVVVRKNIYFNGYDLIDFCHLRGFCQRPVECFSEVVYIDIYSNVVVSIL